MTFYFCIYIYVFRLYPFESKNFQLRDDLRRSRGRIVHLQYQLRLSARNSDLLLLLLGIIHPDPGLRILSPALLVSFCCWDIFFWILLPQYYTPYHVTGRRSSFPVTVLLPGLLLLGSGHRRRDPGHRLPWLSPSLCWCIIWYCSLPSDVLSGMVFPLLMYNLVKPSPAGMFRYRTIPPLLPLRVPNWTKRFYIYIFRQVDR